MFQQIEQENPQDTARRSGMALRQRGNQCARRGERGGHTGWVSLRRNAIGRRVRRAGA